MVNIAFKAGDIVKQNADVLTVGVFADTDALEGVCKQLDEMLDGVLKQEIEQTHFEGKKGSFFHFRAGGEVPAKRIVVVGLGKRDAVDQDAVRQAAASTVEAAKKLKTSSIASVLFGGDLKGMSSKDTGQAIAEGVQLAAYQFTRYKTDSDEKDEESSKDFPEAITFLHVDDETIDAAKQGAEIGRLTAQGTIFARDLVNTPGQHMKPSELVDAAKDIAQASDMIDIEVFDKENLREMGAGGILGVSQGSDHPPYLVHLTYTPENTIEETIALIGKAITFDTGGLSIKPSKHMQAMKLDMGGAATVLGTCSVLDTLRPNKKIHVIFGAAENMISGKAMRPGDVITVMNGKTIEVLNTDAEGRLTLADALTYANKQDPDILIDVATLTGACLVALGEEIGGLMGNDHELVDDIKDAAERSGEKLWELPLEPKYKKQLESPIADYKNIGGRYGGTLTAGLLLQEFVEETPWAHLDIAGPSFAEKPLNNYTKKGATGFGVRTLLSFLQKKNN